MEQLSQSSAELAFAWSPEKRKGLLSLVSCLNTGRGGGGGVVIIVIVITEKLLGMFTLSSEEALMCLKREEEREMLARCVCYEITNPSSA